MNTDLAEDIYVHRDFFDEREEKNQAVVDKNMAEIRSEIKELNLTLNAKIDKVDAKIDRVEDTLSTAIAGLIDRFDDMKDYQNKWFTVFGILFTAAAVIVPISVAVIQRVWK